MEMDIMEFEKQVFGYFNKEPKDLNLYEASLLAGIPNAPSIYAPNKNLNLAKKRQSAVLSAMVKYNYISTDQKLEAMK